MSYKSKNIFCLLNCFDNYQIVSSKIIQMYVQNAIKYIGQLNSSNTTVQTYVETTPWILYSIYMPPNSLYPGDKRSKQYQNYMLDIALVSVTLARIKNADVVLFANEGVVENSGFSSMYTIANILNKPTVLWNDDLRNQWGTTDDMLVIGMTPIPYKYYWYADTKKDQNPIFNSYDKSIIGKVTPVQGSSKDLCPIVNKDNLQKNWNQFIKLIDDGYKNSTNSTNGTLPSRLNNLITLGNLIINYVENDKKYTPYSKYGLGWDLNKNLTLYWDMDYIINQNINLLTPNNQAFINEQKTNLKNIINPISLKKMKKDSFHKTPVAYDPYFKLNNLQTNSISKNRLLEIRTSNIIKN
jgi:hypothetical protein